MAEFCLKRFNKLNHTRYREEEIILEEDFCEGCGCWKPCVMALHPPNFWQRLRKAMDQYKADKSESGGAKKKKP